LHTWNCILRDPDENDWKAEREELKPWHLLIGVETGLEFSSVVIKGIW
jgi:hypothetical protein